ncbi:MAG: Phenylalanine--tRNA ligase beta subunit [Candidatus Taylorbacteria bacterium]|nr:Phenylalanine--tRNA ligase beta subunit [Candidatus Taylorbacteria bacterium]
MKTSTSWLQTYFEKPIPSAEKLADLFTFHAFEVESSEIVGGDTVLDVKVLPDRAHYALCHKGIALEVAAITGLARILPKAAAVNESAIPVSLTVETDLCRRYIARMIRDVQVSDSPAWLKEKLEAVGQRSINTIVDATNYVMLDVGQPLHAFDADKVSGGLVIRAARAGEKAETLDGKIVELAADMLVEADAERVLAIAGIKGGKYAQIDSNTKNIIIIAGNFEPTTVRRTSTKIGIRTDASKRFENNLSPEVVADGIAHLSALIAKLSPDAKFGAAVDHYPKAAQQTKLIVKPQDISNRLGVAISESEMIDILGRLEVAAEKMGDSLELSIPLYRRDMVIFEDIVEEVGRIYGYDKISLQLPPKPAAAPQADKSFYYAEKIKNTLVDLGFSEAYLYTLVAKGDVEIAYPLASDKKALRTNLTEGMQRCLDLNVKNADLLGLDQVKMFEIGTVFSGGREYMSLAIGAQQVKKVKGQKGENLVADAIMAIEAGLGIKLESKVQPSPVGATAEFDLGAIIAGLPGIESYDDLKFGKIPDIKYQKYSLYPFIVRDIALFTPDSVTEAEVWAEIKKGIADEDSLDLLARHALFDVFKKDGKTSYAFRMVFQSMTETLTNDDVNAIMEKIYFRVKDKGWEVR